MFSETKIRKRFRALSQCCLICAIAIGSLVLKVNPAIAQADTGNDGWIAKAIPHWDEFREQAHRIQGTIEVSDIRDGKQSKNSDIIIKQNEKCRLLQSVQVRGDRQAHRVECFNSNYGFSLQRKSGADAWVQTGGYKVDPEADFPTNSLTDTLDDMVMHPFYCARVLLWDLVAMETFKTSGVTEVERDSQTLIQVSFVNPHPALQEPFCPIQGGTLLLDPENRWCITEAKLDLLYGQDVKTQQTVQYEYESVDGVPLFTRVVDQDVTNNFTVIREAQLTIPATLPSEDEFRLPAFGIGEPIEVEPQGSLMWLWFAIAGVVIVTVGVGLHRAYRKRSV